MAFRWRSFALAMLIGLLSFADGARAAAPQVP
ncbi:amino acid ABC transporter, partial [Mesorhizobium sp. M7A.F.Ca.CA.004.04.2.1]